MPEIVALGATLVAVSPQRPEHSRAVARRRSLTFDLLSDLGNQVARQFGLAFRLPAELRELYSRSGIDLEQYNGDASWTLPMPARFVIDCAGSIIAADADPDYTIRPEPSQTVEILGRLRAGTTT